MIRTANTADTNWDKDPVFEFNRKKEGKKRDAREIAISEILVEESKENNARAGQSIIEAHASACVSAMEKGQPIHYVILRHIPGQGYMVIGGNHRIHAAKIRDCTHVMAYVVICDDQEYDLLTRKDNRGATGQTQTEAIMHALYQHSTYGVSLTTLAKEFDIKVDVLRTAHRNGILKKSFAERNIPHENINAGIWARLNTLRKQPAILDRCVHLCNLYIPTIEEVSRILESLQRYQTEQQKLDHLVREEANLKASRGTGKSHPRVTSKVKLFRLLGEKSVLSGLLDKGGSGNTAITHIDQLVFEPKHSADFIVLWEKIRTPMAILYKQCKAHTEQVEADRLRKAKKTTQSGQTPNRQTTRKQSSRKRRKKR